MFSRGDMAFRPQRTPLLVLPRCWRYCAIRSHGSGRSWAQKFTYSDVGKASSVQDVVWSAFLRFLIATESVQN